MVRAFIENFLGQFGTALMNLYDANSLWINSLVVLYGAWVVFSWINLKNIRSRLIQELAGQLRSQANAGGPGQAAPGKSAKGSVLSPALSNLNIPWEGAVREARFPFVAHQTALLPRRLSVEAVQALLPAEELLEDAVQAAAPGGKRKRGA